MNKSYRTLQVCNRHIIEFCKYIVIISTFSIFIVVVVGVFFRYALNNALVWPEETSRFCLIWMVFLGAPIVTYKGEQIAIEIIISRVSGFLKIGLIFLIQFIIFFVLILLLWAGIILSIQAIPQHSTVVLWLSYFYFYIPIPIVGLLMLPIYLELFIKQYLPVRG